MKLLVLFALAAAASAQMAPHVPDEWIAEVSPVQTTVVQKHYEYPTTPHCEDVVANSASNDWWKANGWKYDKWASGKCPSKYNFRNEQDHPASGITHRTMGVKTVNSKKAVALASVAPAKAVTCGDASKPVAGTITIKNTAQAAAKVDICMSAKKGACSLCFDWFQPGSSTVVTLRGTVDPSAYLLFAFKAGYYPGKDNGKEKELYKSKAGKWPSTYTLTDAEATTLAEASSDGACTNTADSTIWAAKKASFSADMATCGKQCLGAGSCVSTCIQKKDGYSATCSACFGAVAQCTKDHCMFKCINGDSAACTDCVKANKCDSDFTTCAGVTPPATEAKAVVMASVGVAQTETTVQLHYEYPTTPHCEDVVANSASNEWWKANGWRYAKWTSGKCPSKYDFTNEKDHPASGITHRTLGVKGKGALHEVFTSVSVTPLTDAIPCGGSDKLLVTNKLRPSMKFRMCSKKVDPKTGWACNHGTPFVDCDRRVNQDEVAEMDVSAAVETVLPVTFTAQGAVDMVSSCYWKKPAGGWPKASVVVDQKWWDALQKSC